MSKTIDNLKKYIEGELKILENDIKFFNINQKEIDARLDRINEIKKMIKELEDKK